MAIKHNHKSKAKQQLTINTLGQKGDGIARGRSGNVFVIRGLPGDVVEAWTFQDREGITRGDITQVITPSPDRVKPPCKYFDYCGGCTLQHTSKKLYTQFKLDSIRLPLEKAGIKAPIRQPHFVPEGTRRRATFAVFLQNKSLTMGYYQRRTTLISQIDECMVCDPELMRWRDKLGEGLKAILKDSRPADLFIQLVSGRADVVITGPVGPKGKLDPPTRQQMVQWANDTGIARLSWRGKYLDDSELILEREHIVADFAPLSVRLPAGAFLQPSLNGEQLLRDAVLAALPEKCENIADLFCGCGSFTGALSTRGRVEAFDSEPTAISSLRNALKGQPHRAVQRDLFRQPLTREMLNKYDVVVFDPPRAGAKEQVEQLALSKVKRVVAVSCNPATFARDAAALVKGGYKLDWVQPVDQFIWSHHIELVASFSRS